MKISKILFWVLFGMMAVWSIFSTLMIVGLFAELDDLQLAYETEQAKFDICVQTMDDAIYTAYDNCNNLAYDFAVDTNAELLETFDRFIYEKGCDIDISEIIKSTSFNESWDTFYANLYDSLADTRLLAVNELNRRISNFTAVVTIEPDETTADIN